jgi:hypothetical protein
MMLGTSPLPSEPYFPPYLKTNYPNAIDGDAVIIIGPADDPQLWVKYGSTWQRGWTPGAGPGMTMEYRPNYKRIIDDQTKSVTTPSDINCPAVAYDFSPPGDIKPQVGDAILQTGPSDAPETWVYGQCGWYPGTTYKRVILDRRLSWIDHQYDESRKKLGLDPITGLPVVDFSTGGGTTATNVDAGKLALIGLIGFLLLRGAIK